ncbi:dual oxidase maturation factor 1-like [Ptychodera flava]|uniref:dual oxidase maturation factor 1-like n=1 Tax=Ptychodera flava TaxID=63121 RepID=UPI00396A14D6
MESPEASDGLYDAFRMYGLPTAYGENKTAVTVDVVEAGLICAAVILAFSYALIIPGIRGRERLFCFIRVFLSLFILLVILLVNFGQEWEVAKISTRTQYKAFTNHEINATIGVKIGLRSVNITLKGNPVEQLSENIDYNERFTWSDMWNQGRLGFGPFAGQISREFREAQYKGLPYPILWIAEYFTLDGERIRWGRSYRQAGFFTHICMWVAFPLWILTNILFFMVIRYGAYFMALTGSVMLLGNLIYATLRDGPDLEIPFEQATLMFAYGWCFWLCLIVGLLCIILAVIVVIMDFRFPSQLATFLNSDLLQDYEDSYEEQYSVGEKPQKRISSAQADESPAEQALNSENGGPMQPGPDEDAVYMNVDVQPRYRPRTGSRFKVSRRKPRAAPRTFQPDTITEQEEDQSDYDVPPAPRKIQGEPSVKFSKPKSKHGVYQVADMEREGAATLSLGDVPLSEM